MSFKLLALDEEDLGIIESLLESLRRGSPSSVAAWTTSSVRLSRGAAAGIGRAPVGVYGRLLPRVLPRAAYPPSPMLPRCYPEHGAVPASLD